MRFPLLAGSVFSLGLLLVASACTTETIIQTVPPDNADDGSSGSSGRGSSGRKPSTSSGGEEEEEEGSSSGGSSSGGSSSGGSSGGPSQGLKSDVLAQGTVSLLGLAGDDAIYFEFSQDTLSLRAVPIAGGAPTKIADIGDNDDAVVSGGAVAIWTSISGRRGTLNVWTRATGLKTNVATDSVYGLFAASEDGTRIAFSQNATLNEEGTALQSTQVGIRDTDAASDAATLTGTTAVNLVTQSCPPYWGFVGKVFIAAHCTGTASAGSIATNAKVLRVPDGAPATVTRLDAASLTVAGTAVPFWIADATASKVLYITTSNSQARVAQVGGDTLDFDTNVAQVLLLSDGSAVIYRKATGELVKATTADKPVTTTLAEGVKAVVALSRDERKLTFRKLDRTAQGLSDLHVVDHTAATPSPVAIESTAAVFPTGFTATSSHALFLGDFSATGPALKAIPVGGGTATAIATGTIVGALSPAEGTGVVFLSNPKQLGTPPSAFNVFDLNFVDVSGGQTAKINESVPQGEYVFRGKRLVYSKLAAQGSGLYAVTLP